MKATVKRGLIYLRDNAQNATPRDFFGVAPGDSKTDDGRDMDEAWKDVEAAMEWITAEVDKAVR